MTRDDLPPGAQLAQVAHAAIDYTQKYPFPPTIAVLAARDELALIWLAADAHQAGIPAVSFREPDLDDAVTAVALGPEGARLCRKFPLALRGGETDGCRDCGSGG